MKQYSWNDGIGYLLEYEGKTYGPYDGDIWDAHDQIVEEIGICPFHDCDEGDKCNEKCERPDYIKEENAIKENPFHGLPLSNVENSK